MLNNIRITNNLNAIATIEIIGYIGQWDTVNYLNFRSEFIKLEANNKRIELIINSGGGEVMEGFAIYDLIKKSPLIVDARIVGMAASMAGVIALAADSISMAENAMWMVHKVKAGAFGDSGQLRAIADLTDKLEARIVDVYSKRTGADLETVGNWMKPGQDFWMNAKDAFAAGICDIIEEKNAAVLNLPTPNMDEQTLLNNVFNVAKEINEIPKKTMKDKIIAMLTTKNWKHTLTNESAEADVYAQLEAFNTANETALNLLQTEVNQANDARIESLVENAVKDGKLTATNKENFIALAKIDFALAESTLNSFKGRVDVNAQIANTGDKKDLKAEWTFEDYSKKDPAALAKMEKENKPAFVALWEAEFGAKYEG